MNRIGVTQAVFAVCLASVSLAGPARAGNQDLYGFGARGPALGGAAIAFPRGFEAIYYNPAGLIMGGDRAFSIGFQATRFDLSIRSPRPADVAGLADEDTVSGVTLGIDVTIPLTGALEDRFAIGLALYIPSQTLLSARLPQVGTPQFSLVADRARALSISAALAIKITEWLRIGGGVRVLAGLGGFIRAGPTELGNLGSDVEDELVARYAGVFGVQANPHPNVSIGAVVRTALGGDFQLPVVADLGGDLPLAVPEINIEGMAVWDPLQVALHVGYRPFDELSIEVGATWKHWSAMPTPIENGTVSVPAQQALDFSDTVVARIGIESEHVVATHYHLAARAGYAYEPSPVGEQTGQHTYLDSDRHIASLGLGAGYETCSGFRVQLDLYGQLHIMTPRTFEKVLELDGAVGITDSPAFPWIGHEGTIFSFGAVVEVQL